MQVRFGEQDVFAAGGIDLTVRGPERIALTGPNGAGMTTLLRLITGELTPDGGDIRRGDGRIAYLSQRLDLLDEPTDNLGLVSAGQLESGLDSCQGAFMVVSHDERFLAEIGVDRRLRVADGTLTEA